MMLDLVRWVLLAAIIATGMAGSVLTVATVCISDLDPTQRGIKLVLAACVASVVYALVYATVPGFSS